MDKMLYFSLFSSPSNEDSSCNESCPSSEGAIEPALPGLINRDEDGIIPRLKSGEAQMKLIIFSTIMSYLDCQHGHKYR